MKKRIAVLLLLTFLFSLSGCFFSPDNPYPYRGDYKELYTVAVYSIPNAEGYMLHGEGAFTSEIYIWEQDAYGRTLFSYCEDFGDQIFGLVLCQAYDETQVYFYPEANYVLAKIDGELSYDLTEDEYLKIRTEDFYLENRDRLKAQNDWGKPLDMSKCVSYAITDHKELGDARKLRSTECDEILNTYSETLQLANPDSTPHRLDRILQVDAEGRILHEIYGEHWQYDNPDGKKTDEHTCYCITLWIITDKNGNYDEEKGVMVMYSDDDRSDKAFIYDSADILEFKNQNGWVYPS